MSERTPRWLGPATEPTDAEVGRLTGDDDPALRGASVSTEPTDAEVSQLMARRSETHRRPSRAPQLGLALGLAMAAVAAVVWLRPVATPTSPEPPVAPLITEVEADWTAQGGTWEEVIASSGTRVVQHTGTVRYTVGARQTADGFVVEAGEVEVAVVGTVFDVGIEPDGVFVEVLQGLVEVRHRGVSAMLGPDQTWSTPRPVVVVAPRAPHRAPTPAMDTALPEPDVSGLADLLARVDGGERTDTLKAELATWAATHDGPLAEAAAGAAVEVGIARMPRSEAITTLDAWIAANPDSARRLPLLELRGDLMRDGRDCEGAIPFYRTVAGEASGARQARAEAWWGLCAAALGLPEANSILERALEHEVAPPLRDEVAKALSRGTFGSWEP